MGKQVVQDTQKKVSEKPRTTNQRRQIEIQLPGGYLSMLLAALFSVIIPWALIVSTCVGVYFSAANNVWMSETKWTDAFAVGASIWALSYGSIIQVGGAGTDFSISLVPLGISFFMVFIGAGMSRRLLGRYRESIIYFVFNYLILTFLISYVTAIPNSRLQLLCGAFTVALLASVFALRKDSAIQKKGPFKPVKGIKNKIQFRVQLAIETLQLKARTLSLKIRHLDYAYRDDLRKRNIGIDRDEFIYDGPKYSWSVPGWVVSGIRLGWHIFGVLLLASVMILLVQFKLYWQDYIKLEETTGAFGFGSVTLVLGQLIYLPVFLIWIIAWYLGVGFYQGADFYRSVFSDASGPYPIIPMLALMPNYQPGYWILLAVVAVSISMAVVAYLSFARVDFFYHTATALVAGITCSMIILLLSWFSYGSIGPGNMQKWGAPPLFLTAILMFELFIPFVLTFLLLHPTVRKCFTRLFSRTTSHLKEIADTMKNKRETQLDSLDILEYQETVANKEMDIPNIANPDREVLATLNIDVDKKTTVPVANESYKNTDALAIASSEADNTGMRVKSINAEKCSEVESGAISALQGRGRIEQRNLNTEEIKEITTNWASSSGKKMLSRFRRQAQQLDTQTIIINPGDSN